MTDPANDSEQEQEQVQEGEEAPHETPAKEPASPPERPDSQEGNTAQSRSQAATESSEPFRLRSEPPKVMRLSRKALAIMGLAAGSIVGGSLIYALQPVVQDQGGNLYDAGGPNRPETITSAPAGYSDAPRLGPPLPGDLGRPILSAREAGKDVPVPATGIRPAVGNDPQAISLQQARQRARQERDSARTSTLFAGGQGAVAPQTETSRLDRSGTGTSIATLPVTPASEQGNSDGQDRKRAFLKASTNATFASAQRVSAPISPYVLQAGSVIPAALVTGIRSDLPGQITAQVTQNVYDSPTGRLLLIPQGSRLIGEYDSSVSAGQRRVLLAWDRLILPGGRSIGLDRQPGTDPTGAAGLEDHTNYHWGGVFKAALISTLLGVGSELTTASQDELSRALRYGTQGTVNQTGQQIVSREVGIPPTLTIRAGFPLRVLVTRDLVIEPSREESMP